MCNGISEFIKNYSAPFESVGLSHITITTDNFKKNE